MTKIYLAGLSTGGKEIISYVIENFPEMGGLCSYYNPKEFQILKENDFRNIMLDSGAYSAFMKKDVIDIDKYISFIKENKEYIQLSVNLDVIGNAEKSKENWNYIKSKGVDCIPVYHYGSSLKYLDYYASKTDYIGIGALVAFKIKPKDLSSFLARITSKYPNHKFHIFGINSFSSMAGYGIYSCDSTTWRVGQKYCDLITRHGRFHLREDREDIWQFILDEYGYTKDDIILGEKKTDYRKILKMNIAETYHILSKLNDSERNINMSLY